MTAKRQVKKDALIFIDTNILLDFYRGRNEGSLTLLGKIAQNMDRIITGSQVEMEFNKNRQQVMVESLGLLKTPEWGGLTAPAFLADSAVARAIDRNKKLITEQHKRLKKKLADSLRDPRKSDPVFGIVTELFENDSPLNLRRPNDIRFKIRRLARKRYLLGYPPRKDKDTSIGDGVNWEWIVECATVHHKDVIIVSRDTDYGARHNDEMILNDWLLKEFKERISPRRNVILTDKLSYAFKLIDVKVTKEEEKQEAELIQETVAAAATEAQQEQKPRTLAELVTEFLRRQAELRNLQAHQAPTPPPPARPVPPPPPPTRPSPPPPPAAKPPKAAGPPTSGQQTGK